MPGYELIDERERQAVNDVFDNGGVLFRHGFDAMRNGMYKVREFEQVFAAKFGVRHAQAVSSGSAALWVGLRALGVGPGDEVITQSHTFVATVEAIQECGATPIVTDIDWSLNMDPGDLERKITRKTKAIVPVHMLGVAAKMQEIMEIANRYGIPVLEDTAQGLGGSYRGRHLGTIGKVGAFSFDHGKVLTTGEGGMVITDNEATYRLARSYHDHGHDYNPAVPRGEDTRSVPGGFNYRMMELQGAIGLVQLGKLEYALERQRANKRRLKAALADAPDIRFREIPDAEGDAGDCLVFFLETPARARSIARELQRQGIGFKNLPDALLWHFTGTWTHIFPRLGHYRDVALGELWSRSDRILRTAIAVPVYIKMDEPRIEHTAQVLRRALETM
jgi:8-amino-3,8-dideoxy-alpha-D-manno-octulosonate transaminase